VTSHSYIARAVRIVLATGAVAFCGSVVTAQAQAEPQVASAPTTNSTPTTSTNPAPSAANPAQSKSASLLVAQNATPAANQAAAQNAQSTGAAPQGETTTAPLETVTVTGSLIKRANAETAEAITILKTDVLKDEGITNVESALNTLTQNVPSLNTASAVGTFSGGGTYANLRGLGQGRTLVLLDGQRLAPNAFTGDAVDLGGIPFGAIDSVQALREGASSLYGSDAIAGVINFITKKNYQGLEVETTLNRPQRNGGASGLADFSFGHGDLTNDGYNFMLTGSYNKQEELRADQRPFSDQGFDPSRGVFATNDPGTWPGSFIDGNGSLYQLGYPGCESNNYLTTYFGNCAYRYAAATDLLPQSGQYSGMAQLTKTLPANNQVQAQYFYTYSTLTAWSGPMFYLFPMDPASPYYPTAAQLATAPCWQGPCTGPPNLVGGAAVWSDPFNNRYSGNINKEQRILLTFSGTNLGWDYKLVGDWSQNKNDNRNQADYPNEFTVGIPGHPALAPGGVLSDLINPFGPQTPAGQALINESYINGVYQLGEDKRWSFEGTASHQLGDLFNSGTPATVAIGGNFGGEHFQNGTTPYNAIVQPATGLSTVFAEGSRTTQALFAELDVPMTNKLEMDLSDRWDRYSDFGTTQNGKVSLLYQPLPGVLSLRGTASTGFRAPTLFDLYEVNTLAASTGGTMGTGNPFCTPATYTPPLWTAADCNTQGLGITGGNRKLTPETSQNFNFGVILSPITDLGITLDYYRIVLKNTISAIPAQAIYDDPTEYAQYIVPNSSGTLTPSIASGLDCIPYTAPTCGYVVTTLQNTGHVTTDGFDLSVQDRQRTPFGTFHEDLEGTSVTQMRVQQFNGGPTVNLVGWFNTLNPAYRWQHLLRFDWESPEHMFGAGLLNRFYSEYIDEFPDGAGDTRHVGSWSTWDAYATYNPLQNLQLLFGIKNILDHEPPYTNASPANGNFTFGYNIFTVDPNLRTFYINVKYTLK